MYCCYTGAEYTEVNRSFDVLTNAVNDIHCFVHDEGCQVYPSMVSKLSYSLTTPLAGSPRRPVVIIF